MANPDQTEAETTASNSVSLRLKAYFAALTCLGGLVLSSGTEGASIPVMAVFFAAFGFIFVDWLQFFALPSVAAYAAMGVAAMFCVSDFVELNAPGQHQMGVVAQLLVFVQAILMLQTKTRRIYEQLGVFCLLELIVAAVFNDALLFGLLLLPIALVGAMALSLMSARWVTEGSADPNESKRRKKTAQNASTLPLVRSNPSEAWTRVAGYSGRIPKVALLTLAPAVFLIAIFFFYALPRTTDATRVQSTGNATVGFSDELQLGQIGQMMQSSQPALRVYLRDQDSGEPYKVAGGIYLRGKVLEEYREFNGVTQKGASWRALPRGFLSEPEQLPNEYVPTRSTDEIYYDSVDVKIVCEEMRSESLFAIAPYHRTQPTPAVMHFKELWTVQRQGKSDWTYPRIEYQFGSNAFRSGVQAELKTYRQHGEPFSGGLSNTTGRRIDRLGDDQRRTQDYIDRLLAFAEEMMPTLPQIAEPIVTDTSGDRRSDYEIAKAMERHFSSEGIYQYTLNLNAEPVPGLDPIEQFVRIDKRGHCQYFASALVMMLRSQGIPARVVAGYHTDEYNNLTNLFIARQLHAHAWVEALIEVEDSDATPSVYGQPRSQKYWLRLDPTPPAGRVRETNRVNQVFDMAQTMWDDYVVDMDAEKQDSALQRGGSTSMNQSYKQMIGQMGLFLSRLRAGELGGGSLASRNWFSWQAAVLAAGIGLAVLSLFRVQFVRRRRRSKRPADLQLMTPSVDFYAETIRQIERLGVQQQLGQTPTELSDLAVERFRQSGDISLEQPLRLLTALFYRQRFGVWNSNSGLATQARMPDASAKHVSASIRESDSKEIVSDTSSHSGPERALAELTQGVDAILSRNAEMELST